MKLTQKVVKLTIVMNFSRLVPLLFFGLTILPSSAVVIGTATGTENTTAPATNDFGFANIGTRGAGTGIYLGGGWVMSASHVGAGPVTFGGVSYALEAGTTTRIANPSGLGLSTLTDIIVFKIVGDPGLPALNISSTTPLPGTRAIMIGAGRDREANVTYWDVNTAPNPDVWTEQANPGGAEVSGYKTLGTRSIRYGENNIEGVTNVNVGGGRGDVISLFTDFDENGGFFSTGLPEEAQASVGDSGGALFVETLGGWELAGMIHAVSEVSSFDDADLGPNSPYALIDESSTFAADLSQYRTQILDAIPEPHTASFCVLSLCGIVLRRSRSSRLSQGRQTAI